MAKLVQALRKYGPRLERKSTIGTKELTDWLAQHNRMLRLSFVLSMFIALHEAILAFNSQGIAVKIDGIGIFSPSIDRNGVIKFNCRIDAGIRKRGEEAGFYQGKIINEERIGLDNTGYKELWDADHPDDPLEI